MEPVAADSIAEPTGGLPLEAFLLGRVTFDELLALQGRLIFDVSGDGNPAAIVCEHPAGVTIGRDGSWAHLRWPAEEYDARGWPIRWLGRGGGCLIHLPGQVACYPIIPLDRLGVTVHEFVRRTVAVVAEVVASFGITPVVDGTAIRVGGRRIAHVGVAIRSGVSGFGAVFNVSPDLELVRCVACDGDSLPMTSLLRECANPVRLQAVRQRWLDSFTASFGFGRLAVFHHHPCLSPSPGRHATAFRR